MPVQHLIDTYKAFGFGEPTGLGLTGESAGLMPHRRYWGQLDRATFAFGYGLMVTPLQLAHVYATIGGFGIARPLSITRIDPPVMGTRVMPESIVHSVEHMMESVALPGGGGTKAAVRDYRVAVKTGTAKKIGPDGKYIDKYVAYTAGVAPRQSTTVRAGGGDERSEQWFLLRRRCVRAGLQPDHGRCPAAGERHAGRHAARGGESDRNAR